MIAILFKKVRDSGDYGPCLFVLNDGSVNVPAVWYKFRKEVIGQTAEDRAARKADQEKDIKLQCKIDHRKSLWDSVYAPPQFVKRARTYPQFFGMGSFIFWSFTGVTGMPLCQVVMPL